MRTFILGSSVLFFVATALAQAPPIEWKKCLGGSGAEGNYPVMEKTSDGGAIVVCTTNSNDGDVSGNHGNFDGWVVKLSATGAVEWQKTLGGTAVDHFYAVKVASDGGYLVAGHTYSNDGDVVGFHGAVDLWVVKLDSAGDLLWQRPLGGSGSDAWEWVDFNGYWQDVLDPTGDGGCVLAMSTTSNDGDVTGHHGGYDIWVVRLDGNGTLVWQKALGGTAPEHPVALDPCTDGGWIVAGVTSSDDGDVVGYHGSSDIWTVKLDAAGAVEWTRALGGANMDAATEAHQTSDGGYIIAGSTMSDNDDVTGHHGAYEDFWAVKLDASGSLQWQKCVGGTDGDRLYHMRESTAGSFLLVGEVYSGDDGDVSGYHGTAFDGGHDTWVVSLDPTGSLEWQLCLGGTGAELPHNMDITNDGGCIIYSYTNSTDGDVTNHNGGAVDGWLTKVSAAGVLQWQKTLGDSGEEWPNTVLQTSEGGYLAASRVEVGDGLVTGSGYHGGRDMWVVKLEGGSVGIEDNEIPSFTISPVPADDQLRVTTTTDMAGTFLRISDALGREVLRTQLNGSTCTLDVSGFPSGSYFVSLGTRTQHLVVE